MEFVLGSLSAVGAGIFSNPLDVLKTKAQLQGELRNRGKYHVHYKNMFHAAYVVSKEEGILALQKGLVPALLFQVALNGTRLGFFQVAENHKLTRKEDGSVSLWRTMIISSFAGSLGAFLGSPFYLVKTQIQSQAPIAVVSQESVVLGHQHRHKGSLSAYIDIYKKGGIHGLWVGSTGSMVRVAIGSCAQLSTYSTCKEFIENQQFFADDAVWSKAFASSMLVGVVVASVMTPFDTIATRLYNQKRDAAGRGTLYSGIYDCLSKTYKYEGIRGLYKGLLPVYFRIGPHSMLNLMFWEKLKDTYSKHKQGELF